jgi:hypothetical protein
MMCAELCWSPLSLMLCDAVSKNSIIVPSVPCCALLCPALLCCAELSSSPGPCQPAVPPCRP